MIDRLVERNIAIFINLTGGCGEILPNIMNQSGASHIFIGAQVPYSKNNTVDLIGNTDKFLTNMVAIKLANDAYIRACKYSEKDKNRIGIGITASLKVDNQRPGRLNMVIYCIRYRNVFYISQVLLDETLSRPAQSQIVVENILEQLIDPTRGIPKSRTIFNKDILGLWNEFDDTPHTEGMTTKGDFFIYPITGNPLHYRHLEILKWAEKCLNMKGYFQFSTIHPNKGAIDFNIIKALIEDTYGHASLLIDYNNSLYIDKYKRYKCPIVMGDDAFMKISDSDRYNINHPIYVVPRQHSPVQVLLKEGIPLMMPLDSISSSEIRNG